MSLFDDRWREVRWRYVRTALGRRVKLTMQRRVHTRAWHWYSSDHASGAFDSWEAAFYDAERTLTSKGWTF